MSGLKSWVGNRNGISAPDQSATNGGSHTAITPANRRQVAAAQARMPPPPTRLARQPLQVPVDAPKALTYNSVAPSQRELEDRSRVMAEQFDSQDHFGGAFDTDVEGMDETSILSETQVKDSQVDDQVAPGTTRSWGTRQLDKDWNHAVNQPGNDQHDAPMGNYEDENAEGTDNGEASGLDGEEDISDDEALAPEDDATVVSMNLARELQEMKADSSWRPLVERPKERANLFNQQNQAIPKPAVRHFPEPNTQARGRAMNGVHNTHNAYPDITSGDSDDLDDRNDEVTRKKGYGPTNRQNGPHKSRKRPDSQTKVVRVPQVKQPHQMRPPPAQQPPEEVPRRSVKQEQPLNHHQPPDTSLQSPNADKPDETKDIKPDLSDTNNNNNNDDETNSAQNAAPPPTTALLPEHPPPQPRKRRLSLDYEPTTLHTMTYTDLQTQPFDHNPRPPPSPLPESLLAAPLPSKLQHITTLRDEADRSTFFSTLPLAEWEDAGDWFVERFGELVKKMRDARTERRRVAAQFEDEVARREEYVRRSREGVEGEMRKMRKGGEDVLRNKVT